MWKWKKTQNTDRGKITGYTVRSTTGLYQLKGYSLGFKSGYYLGYYYHEHEKELLAHLHCFKTNQIGGSLQALLKKNIPIYWKTTLSSVDNWHMFRRNKKLSDFKYKVQV